MNPFPFDGNPLVLQTIAYLARIQPGAAILDLGL